MPTIEARLHINPRRALDMLRQDRKLRRAAKQLPRPTTWEWARARIMPLLAGPYLGPEPLVTIVAEPGCATTFGIEVAGTYVLVDRMVAERWEVRDAELQAAAMANLEQRAADLTPASLIHGTLSGRIVRMLEAVPWASSLVLAPEHLIRIFGPGELVLATPHRGLLVGCSTDTPSHVIAEIVIDLEYRAAYPLMLDPFLLTEGKVIWEQEVEFEDDD